MAFEVKKINPLDLQSRKAVGINLPFSTGDVFSSNYQTKDAIKNNLINFFLTGKGERYLNPMFGTGIRNMLFENITADKLIEIETLVRNVVDIYFPRIKPSKVEVASNPDTNLVSFYMSYSIKDAGINDELLINIAN
jgi:phage baseplate assembly protein W